MIILEHAPLQTGHALGGKAGAQRFEFGHHFEHAGKLIRGWLRHHRSAMRAHLDQSARHQQADGLAHRRARHFETLRQPGFVERRAGRQCATDDLVGELQAQFLGQRLARRSGRWRVRNGGDKAHGETFARALLIPADGESR